MIYILLACLITITILIYLLKATFTQLNDNLSSVKAVILKNEEDFMTIINNIKILERTEFNDNNNTKKEVIMYMLLVDTLKLIEDKVITVDDITKYNDILNEKIKNGV